MIVPVLNYKMPSALAELQELIKKVMMSGGNGGSRVVVALLAVQISMAVVNVEVVVIFLVLVVVELLVDMLVAVE